MHRSLSVIAFIACFTLVYSQHQTVTILVIPEKSGRDSSLNIFIAGNKKEFGNWNPSAVALNKQNDSLWKFEASFDSGEVIEFKLTRGSWQNQAIYDRTIIPANTIIKVRKDTTIMLRPIYWNKQLLSSGSEKSIRGKVKYHRGLAGAGLAYKRDVIVWLPPLYEKNKANRYPVLYMHDGQNIFDPATSFTGNDWRIDEVTDSLIRLNKIEEIIIVGIYNSPDRLPEYSDSPLGTAYMKFIVDVLKPLIDSTYRTKRERKYTAVMGSSMGALSSLLLGWKYPNVFGMIGCMSTSFWYDNEKTLKDIRSDTGAKKKIKIYLDCGGREKELLSGYKRMTAILKKKGYKKGRDFEYHLEKNGAHSEVYWAKRVWRPLVFMFGG
ncbi:MAG: alpha/beta hydrolase-fold protein, partial [Bacteroidota bacterium]|nr:alpha/beta hydrolase-fold protein [Bacteroidota bacterium]